MNPEKLREDFPILKSNIIYFDNACVSLKPRQVVEAMNDYYYNFPACGQRSEHRLGKKVTESVEKSRKAIKDFFNAKSSKEIIFTKNTTESINIVAHSVKKDECILLTDKEHNSNLIPWQVAGKIRILKSKPDMTFDMEAFESELKGMKLVSFVHTSNLDGYTIPAKEIIKISHEHDVPVMLDAAQSGPHRTIDAKKLDVDFLACSGHKMLGPSGIGILYGKQHMLEKLKPFSLGGNTVSDSTYESHKLLGLPERFEAGLQNYAGIIGFAEAVNYLEKVGMENIEKHETMMNKLVTESCYDIPRLSLIGPKEAEKRGGIFNFNITGMSPGSVSTMLDSMNIMTRSGYHCVHSWFNAHNIKGSCRASFYLYNTVDEAKKFCSAVGKIAKLGK